MKTKKRKLAFWFAAALLVALVLPLSTTFAQGKGNGGGGGGGGNGGGGGGGGGGDTGPTLLIAPLENLDLDVLVWPLDINDQREVVGTIDLEQAAYWTVSTVESNGETTVESELTPLDGGEYAHSINNQGEIVGWSSDESGNTVAVYWQSPSSSAITLPSPNHPVSQAYSISNDGLIVGTVADSSTADDRPVVWRVTSPNGTPVISDPVVLPADGDGLGCAAYEVNDSVEGFAQIVGYQRSPVAGEGGPFLWTVESDGSGSVTVSSVASLGEGNFTAINNSGICCGRFIGGRATDAVAWSGETLFSLDRGSGRNKAPEAWAWDIGDGDLIVGKAGEDVIIGDYRACFWDGIDGSLTYLDTFLEADLTLDLYEARAVNGNGDIVGSGNVPFIAVSISQ